jgi:uncharacterized protein (TIGR02284 family)
MTKDLKSLVNNIIQFLYDSHRCYQCHVDNVSDPNLKAFFSKLSAERLQMINEIKNTVIEAAAIEPSGTMTGSIHQFYENLKSLITSGDPLSISKEIKRGENILVEYYKEALRLDLPEMYQHLFRKHMAKVESELVKADFLAVNSV